MKMLLSLAAVSGLLAVSPPASAQTARGSGSATTHDLQRLQDSLTNLDESLADLDPEHPRTGEFQERAADIREDLVWLKVEMRRHQKSGSTGWGASRVDIEEIRRSIVELQADVDGALRRASSRPNETTLEEGTEIQVRLEDRLSSATARREDRFEASVSAPVRNRGLVVIPAGTRVLGVVQSVERGERPSKAGRLDLSFHAIYLDDRTRTDMRTRVVQIDQDVDRGDQAKKAGIGAVLGGVLGSMIGGSKGAVIGVLVGGAGGVMAKSGEDAVLPAGTVLTLSLERPLTIVQEDVPDRR